MDIWEYPNLELLEGAIEKVYRQALEEIEWGRREKGLIDNIELDSVIITGEWGNGRLDAEPEETPLEVSMVFDIPATDLENLATNRRFKQMTEEIVDKMGEVAQDVEVPEDIRANFPQVNFVALSAHRLYNLEETEDGDERRVYSEETVGIQPGDSIFDLTRMQIVSNIQEEGISIMEMEVEEEEEEEVEIPGTSIGEVREEMEEVQDRPGREARRDTQEDEEDERVEEDSGGQEEEEERRKEQITQDDILRELQGTLEKSFEGTIRRQNIEEEVDDDTIDELETMSRQEMEQRAEEIADEIDDRVEEKRLARKFPDVPEGIREFAVSSNQIEVPFGKETKSLEPRELYDWEVQAIEANTEFEEHIGHNVSMDNLKDIPASTFPRTSHYIKNRLLRTGPSYKLEIYNDLLVYTAYANAYHNMSLKPGTYLSMRRLFNNIENIPQEGGPKLVEPLSQQQAASRGLEVTPDHPTIDGGKADWLENRQYYIVVEENVEHPAWNNPTKYLYEELER
jgi:hypothetical protein